MMRLLWSSIIRSQLSHDELLEFTSLRSAETLFAHYSLRRRTQRR